jgi:hypothetical protein
VPQPSYARLWREAWSVLTYHPPAPPAEALGGGDGIGSVRSSTARFARAQDEVVVALHKYLLCSCRTPTFLILSLRFATAKRMSKDAKR